MVYAELLTRLSAPCPLSSNLVRTGARERKAKPHSGKYSLLGFRGAGDAAKSTVVSISPPVGFCFRSLHQNGQPVSEFFQLRATPLGRNAYHGICRKEATPERS